MWTSFRLAAIFMLHKLWTVDQDSKDFPPLLQEMSGAPKRLYGCGNRDLLQSKTLLAMVGTRKATRYGKQVVHDVVPMLVANGIATVSGLAFGIDSAAHEETLQAGGHTIAVLGSSVVPEEIHPSGQQWLARRIVNNGGLLLSEYPPGATVHKYHFPARNRIIAGLARATVVVEAPERSGALITARMALDHNRDVFAVPGSIYAKQSVGCNQLIARGAMPLLSCQQFRDALELFGRFEFNSNDIALPLQLTPEDQQIVGLCSLEPLTVDDLVQRIALPPHHLIQRIAYLSLRGVIKEVDGHRYSS